MEPSNNITVLFKRNSLHSLRIVIAGWFILCSALITNNALAQADPELIDQYDALRELSNQQIVYQHASSNGIATHILAERLATGAGELPANTSEAVRLYSLAARRGYPGSPAIGDLPHLPVRIPHDDNQTIANRPIARITADVSAGTPPLQVNLSASDSSVDAGILWQLWDNGNGARSNANTITSEFNVQGNYYPTLIVVDTLGQIAIDHTLITVNEPTVTDPPPPPTVISPASESVVIEGDSLIISWAESATSTGYRVDVFSGLQNENATAVVTGTLPASSCYATNTCSLSLDTDDLSVAIGHRWNLYAVNSIGESTAVIGSFALLPPTSDALDAPVLITPQNQSDFLFGQTVTSTWTFDPNAALYEIQLINSAGDFLADVVNLSPADICDSQTATCSVSQAGNLPVANNYQVRLRALNAVGYSAQSSATFSIVEPPEEPATPVNLRPVFATELVRQQVIEFVWAAQSNASSYNFHWFDASSSVGETGFVYGLDPATICSSTECSYSRVMTLPVRAQPVHAWRVQAVNSFGVSDWSRSTFSVREPYAEAPGRVTLLSPSSGITVENTALVSFSWSTTAFAETYVLELLDGTTQPPTPAFSRTVDGDLCAATQCVLDVNINLPLANSHLWQVRATNELGDSLSTRASLRVVAPTTVRPISPVNLQPNNNDNVIAGIETTFTWDHDPTVSTYDVYLFDNSNTTSRGQRPFVTGLDPFDLCANGSCSYTTVLQNLAVGWQHFWHVRGVNYRGASSWTRAFITMVAADGMVPAVPTVLSPLNDSLLEAATDVSFTWQPALLASTYELELLDSTNSLQMLQSATVPAANCSATACNLNLTIDLPVADEHAWRVRAVNAAGNSAWTNTLVHVVAQTISVAGLPVQVSPLNNANVARDLQTDFIWQAVANAASYDLQLVDRIDDSIISATLTNLRPRIVCAANGTCLSNLLINNDLGDYRWQVRSVNSSGASAWAETPITIVDANDAIAQVPDILNPQDNAVLEADTSNTFAWTTAANATRYNVEIIDQSSQPINPITAIVPAANCSELGCSIAQALNFAESGPHNWRVQAVNAYGSSQWQQAIFQLLPAQSTPPSTPVITQPIANADIIDRQPIGLLWQAASNAVEFDIALINAQTNATSLVTTLNAGQVCNTNGGSSMNCSFAVQNQLPFMQGHSIRISAANSAGSSDVTSVVFNVVEDQDADPPEAPLLISPQANAVFDQTAAVTFSWQPVASARSYDVQIVNAINGEQDLVTGLVSATVCDTDIGLCSYSTTLDLPESNAHQWQVRSVSGTRSSAFTSRIMSIIDTGREAPTAAFIIAGFQGNAVGAAPLALAFDPSASGDNVAIENYRWDFGDGTAIVNTTSATSVEHTYSELGTFTVTLTVFDGADLLSTATRNVTAFNPDGMLDANEAARFLTQATFGPSRESIAELQVIGIDNWLDRQLSLQGPPHLDYVLVNSNNSNRAARHEVWWTDVVEGDDQLRQRVAFALSQIFVVADTGFTLSNAQWGTTRYYDILRENAFGNYRELLEAVTLSPVMGLYLSMLQNSRGDADGTTRPDENFAREVLQLFSIGLYELNIDGTSTGVNSYNQLHVEDFARVFTGWNYGNAIRWDQPLYTGGDLVAPMEPNEAFHDNDQKTLLNGAIAAAGLSARDDLEFALDNIFNHANVGPFITRQLIMRLVTSNPSPDYVARVATVFNDNGDGIRGDLGAVVRAILTDPDARTIPSDVAYGKLREPVLRFANLWRAFDVQRGTRSSRGEYNTAGSQLMNLESVTGQAVLRSPSVFNFYRPDYSPIGIIRNSQLLAPEFEINTEANLLSTNNRISDQIQLYIAGNGTNNESFSHLNLADQIAIAADTEALLDDLDLLMMSGNMSAGLRQILTDYTNTIGTDTAGLRRRVQDAIMFIMVSPDYLIQM